MFNAVLALTIVGVLNSGVAFVCSYIAKRTGTHRRDSLWDIGHVLLPNCEKYQGLADWCITPLWLLLVYHFCFYPEDREYFTDLIWILAEVLGLRVVTIMLTILPGPGKRSVQAKRWGYFIQTDTLHDMIFSGHTSQGVISALFLTDILEYNPILVFGWVSLTSLFYCACHLHYSVDIVLGCIISYYVYSYRMD